MRATTTGLTFAALPDGARVAAAPASASTLRVVDLPRSSGRSLSTPLEGVAGGEPIACAALVDGVALQERFVGLRVNRSPA
ncbi:MAG: hypothetical protein KIT58_07290 [Planctomycetota bacterium]|nr:hypothetical protein [Planctomycetota bacterium]